MCFRGQLRPNVIFICWTWSHDGTCFECIILCFDLFTIALEKGIVGNLKSRRSLIIIEIKTSAEKKPQLEIVENSLIFFAVS